MSTAWHIFQVLVLVAIFAWCLRWAAPVINEVLTYSEGEQ